MKKSIIIIGGICLMALSLNANADAAAGKAKTSACVSCHGLNGKSNNPKVPHLKGQQKMYLIKALKDYRDKKRDDAMMNMVTGKLSDADIDDIAAFYSSQK